MKKVTTHEAKTHLSRLLKEASAGEEIVILSGKEPVGKLVPFSYVQSSKREIGMVTSAPVTYDADAFEPMNDDALKVWGL
ncbi:MAG: type II toxin-antitoxin system Phd/YefM family antitoxin [Kiritimatiellia bacterium]